MESLEIKDKEKKEDIININTYSVKKSPKKIKRKKKGKKKKATIKCYAIQ